MTDRRIEFEGIRNVRDLGSLQNKEGKTIRKGALIRSAMLANATDNDLKKLQDMNLDMVIDLRSIPEAAHQPDRYPENTHYINNYIFCDEEEGISHDKDEEKKELDLSQIDLRKSCREMVNDEEQCTNVGKALRLLINHDYSDGCVLWHCSEGKDRCGLLTVFTLAALGVDEETIKNDYLLTNLVNEAKAEYFYQLYKSRGRSEKDCEGIRNVFLAKEEYLDIALKSIKEKHGSLDNFLNEGLGISDDEIKEFRNKLLV